MVGKSTGLRAIGIKLSLILALPVLAASTYADKKAASSAIEPGSAMHAAVKVVSLAPSNTELLYSISAESTLAGTCTFCDFPAAAKRHEKVGTFVSANIERLTRLKPDIVVLVGGQEALAGMLSHNGFHVRILQNSKLSDISSNLRALGVVSGHEAKAQAVAGRFDLALSSLAQLLSVVREHPRVFYCVWPQPLLTVGRDSFLGDVVTTCGGVNVAGSTAGAYPQFSAERLLISDPDVIILPYEARGKISLNQAPWSVLRAVKTAHTFFLPEPERNGLIRPTLRIIDGLYWLSLKLHPELAASLQRWREQSAKAVAL